jgi:hypothetical protein
MAGTDAYVSDHEERSFLLQRAQPAMTGLIDGSLSTLAPIFSLAIATQRPHYACFAGLATAIGAGVSMAFSEGLSDTGDLTGRNSPTSAARSPGRALPTTVRRTPAWDEGSSVSHDPRKTLAWDATRKRDAEAGTRAFA